MQTEVLAVPPDGIALRAIAPLVAGVIDGDPDTLITGVSSIEDAEHGDIVFAESQRYLAQAARSRASAVVCAVDAAAPSKPLIKVENPRLAFARILDIFAAHASVPEGIDARAVVGRDVVLGEGVGIGPLAVIGDGVRLGDRVSIGAGCCVGDGCALGDDTYLHSNVTLYAGCRLGARVIVHSGAVIGSDGFGYIQIGNKSEKVPHIGTVELGDDVEIGANTTIDRAKTGVTTIGARTKVDNLVHIAHNVQIGSDCIVVALVGIAGSTQIGRGVILAGQAGVKDHVTIGDGAMVLGRAGVIGDVPSGGVYSGFPARPHKARMRSDAAAIHLPEYARRIKDLEARNDALLARVESLERALGAGE